MERKECDIVSTHLYMINRGGRVFKTHNFGTNKVAAALLYIKKERRKLL